MNLFQRYLRQGSDHITDQYDVRRVMFLNLFYGITWLTLLAAIAQSQLMGEPSVVKIILISAFFLLAIGPLLVRWNISFAALYITVIVNGLVYYFSLAQGLASATFIYYFPLFFATGWMMDFRKPLISALLLSTTFTSILLVVFSPSNWFELDIQAEVQHATFLFNVSSAATIVCINTLVIAWVNYRRQQELQERVEEREKVAAQLSGIVKEKEILMAEIHHRVKNNLAVVRGLLNMQMNTTTNEVAKATLQESVNRVSTIALIHQKLYSRENAESIDFGRYVSELVQEISTTYNQNGAAVPHVKTNVIDITLTLTRAVPCGLIVNELLSNAFKHAFRNRAPGVIDINIEIDQASPGRLNMIVSDNGVGLPENFDPERSNSLGMSIVQSLSEQLDGDFRYESSAAGTRMLVNCPILSA